MSKENVEFARAAYADPRGLPSLVDRIAPDAVFDLSEVYPEAPVLHGVDQIREFRRDGPWGELHFEPERFVDLDAERVLVLVNVSAVGKGSGVAVDQRAAHELTIRDGILVRFKVHVDPDAALAAETS